MKSTACVVHVPESKRAPLPPCDGALSSLPTCMVFGVSEPENSTAAQNVVAFAGVYGVENLNIVRPYESVRPVAASTASDVARAAPDGMPPEFAYNLANMLPVGLPFFRK